MARAHSFVITVSNNKTEREGIDYLQERETGFFYVDRLTRRLILDLLGQPYSFARAFDMVYIPRYAGETVTPEVIETHLDEIILIELKTTKKFLPENPKGFFFGATENEFEFGRRLGAKFRFCFVCLNPLSLSAKTLSVPFGSTHQAFPIGSQQQSSFEVIVLEDLLNWMQNPQNEEARQTRVYHEA